MNNLSWEEFQKVEMRIGTIIDVQDFPQAKNPAFKLVLDFGPEIGVLKSSAQITMRYGKEELLNKQVVAVVNFPKQQIGNFMSECLVLGAVDGKEVTLIQPGGKVEDGLRIA